ncbi:TPA: hypothetical protein ACH3X2_012289, partial [Trebouxia sp. C0005]
MDRLTAPCWVDFVVNQRCHQQELRAFLSSIDSRHVDHADAIHKGEFTNQAELAAADRTDLEKLGIPKGAAGLIIAAAGGKGSSASDEVQADIQEIKKMLKSRSEATRYASNISGDDLQAVLTALKCRVISIQDEELEIMEDVECAWAANKYEPQQQEEYLQALEKE